MSGVLGGVRVLELGGIGPGPHAAMMLADLGADVVRVEPPTPGVHLIPPADDAVLRNRRSIAVDLKSTPGRDMFLSLVDRADVLLEGFRPGVVERLGVGPAECLARNPRLVYGRMTGWGQSGPLARRAGHDINYLALTGALHAVGRPGAKPFPPLNLVGDLGGGSLFLVVGILAALFERERSGQGQIVDAAMVDGVSTLMAMYWSLTEHRLWSAEPGTHMTDGAAPFYNTYACADGRYVAVGAVEPPFYHALVTGLGLDPAALPPQLDPDSWPDTTRRFEEIFVTRTRDEWAAHFADTDACVTPVLALNEVADHPHIQARGTVETVDERRQPAPAPRFSRHRPPPLRGPHVPGSDLAEVLRDWIEPETNGQVRTE
ncbi:CaiB/BaiF CoA-transferase family protein [Phytohabitans sp. ZYX-F-186]|uniref:CaiB/BaiF CoA-transferase family protein n=1 Tax=Phytohabitans maris TaxID=3071409 RepID=A0ABU0ZXB8_9ACTN|nr:CaiB/BaiF CoA-transferase family protein [Phytohabitans sp. ZYX-F-186]MDQ7910850.1 CaiB/BaiF CoA-transferase family protein [Phytohabitans sp. ZYX-F-186]